VYKKADKVPAELKDHLDVDTFEKARSYGKDKCNFAMFSEFYGMVVLTVSLCTLFGCYLVFI